MARNSPIPPRKVETQHLTDRTTNRHASTIATRFLFALTAVAILSFVAFIWLDSTPVRSVAKPIAGRAVTVVRNEDGAQVLGVANSQGESHGGLRNQHPRLVPDTNAAAGRSDPERWANALLARYLLSSPGAGKTDWALVLIDQQAGVIDAQLSGPDGESQQFTGHVSDHHVELFDEVPWDIYQLSFKNDPGQMINMRIECTDSLVSGGGEYVDGEDRRSFAIESSE